MDAAEAWVSGTLNTDRVQDDAIMADAQAFGFDPEAMAGLMAHLHRHPTHFAVWEVNAPIVDAFLCVATQWNVVLAPLQSGLTNRVIGLNYAGAMSALQALAIPVTPELWTGITIMEAGALRAFNKVN